MPAISLGLSGATPQALPPDEERVERSDTPSVLQPFAAGSAEYFVLRFKLSPDVRLSKPALSHKIEGAGATETAWQFGLGTRSWLRS